jgi:hypothetical protein
MKKYVACLLVATAATLFAIPAVAGAQTRHSKHANQGKHGFIVVSRHRGHEALFVQRSHARAKARIASCPAGQLNASYCSAPVEQTLFGAYAWNDGGVTFGSTNSTTCKALGYASTAKACGVYTTVANELIVAFVSSDGPTSASQTITVSCTTSTGGTCPVTFKKVVAENGGGGDSEVWYADASAVISQTSPIFVTAKATSTDCGTTGKAACDVSLQAVTFENAITAGASGAQGTGIGASNACYSKAGAPTCSLTTTEPDSQVWAAAIDPKSSTIPTWPSNQFAIGVADSSNNKAFYTQFIGTCTANANGSKPCTTMPLPASGLYQNPFTIAPATVPAAGTSETINDTAPTGNPYNLALVEIL